MRTVLLTCLVSLLAIGAAADPRWWRHDRLITDPANRNLKAHPDVALVTGSGTAGGATAIFVTWDEVSSIGTSDVYLDASFDGGCTWCGPVLWAGSSESETRPRVDAGVTPIDRLSVQVVFERNGGVWVAGDASISVFDSATAKCMAFGRLTTPVPINLAGAGTRPRLAAAGQQSAPRFLHFHAVWDGPNGIAHGSDLIGDGAGWGTTPPSRPGPGTTPDVAADVVGTTTADSGVTITAVNGGVAQMIRSADSGGTWLAPVAVSGQTTAQVVPVIDSSTAGFEGQVWNGVTWQDATSDQITFDAAFWTDPTMRSPDFAATPVDHPASTQPNTPGIAPALSVASSVPGLAGGTPFFTFWQTDATPIEVVSRGGELSPFGAMPRDLSVFPFRVPSVASRVAPPDNPVSEVRAHSNCLWDDDWLGGMTAGRCDVQPHAGTGAIEVASADGFGVPAIFATVFADDRSGASHLYFKITDTRVSPPTLRSVTGSCQGLQRVDGQAIILTVGQCGTGAAAPAVDERMDRYLLYYGSQTSQTPPATNSGPFLSRVERPAFMGSPIPLAGLRPLETYHFYLIGEDEARNISPMSFNPLVSGNPVAGNTVQWLTIQTPGPCSPAFDYNCGGPMDNCGGVSDGVFQLGETVTMTVFLTNTGDWAATNITGRVVASNATVVNPPGGLFNIAGPVAPTATVQVDVTLRLPSTCPAIATVGLTLDQLQSDGGLVTFGPFSCGSVLTIDCSGSCTNSCLAANLSAIKELKGVKDGAGGATFSWLPDPSPDVIEYHLNSVTVKTDLVEPNVHLPMATLQCTPTPQTATSCTDPDAIGDGTLLFYQVFSACSSSGADEGPFFP